jgi:molybdate transport system ATP-binding protein
MQDPLLFPHLTVGANVAFGPRAAGRLSRRESRAASQHWLDECDAAELVDRMPRQLSGGQAQRVALARALAAEPDVLLLDEPLTGLDVTVAAAMRRVLRRVLARDGRCALLVTHDVLDVVTLADRVVVLEQGRIVESGSTAAILATPRSRFGARFAGVNLVAGRAGPDGAVLTGWGSTWHGHREAAIDEGDSVVAVFAPSAIAVYRDKPFGSPRNVVEIVVAELDSRGPAIRIRGEEQPDGAPGLAADVTAEAATDLRLALGDRLFFVVKSQQVSVHAGP